MTFSKRQSMFFLLDDHLYHCDVTQTTSCQRRVSVKTYHLTRLYLHPIAFYHVTENSRESYKDNLKQVHIAHFK